jgi:hypothetical protein
MYGELGYAAAQPSSPYMLEWFVFVPINAPF